MYFTFVSILKNYFWACLGILCTRVKRINLFFTVALGRLVVVTNASFQIAMLTDDEQTAKIGENCLILHEIEARCFDPGQVNS